MKKDPPSTDSFWTLKYAEYNGFQNIWRDRTENYPDRHYKKLIAKLLLITMMPKEHLIFSLIRRRWDHEKKYWVGECSCAEYGMIAANAVEQIKKYAGVKE